MTTQHPHADGHGHHHPGQEHGHGHDDESGMAEVLDLDALLLREHLQEIFDWTAAQAGNPRTIVDLGAGTGTGTLGMARTFPQAAVVAVDQSEFMLGRLAANVGDHHLESRVTTLQADLDAQWPELADIDLVWAASSMHHLKDPARAFGEIRRSLSTDGMLVVVEMDALPRYLPADLGFGTPGLEERCHQLLDEAGWNAHPDWSSELEAAGFATAARQKFHYAPEADGELLVRIASTFLSRMRSGLAGQLSADDLATLDQLLDLEGPHGLAGRNDLSMRGSRTAWAVRPR
ncbi:class I SAM-dependent methyltransferase [Paeniglutamicibacter sp. MACA_103]|uniref:class I SAM-dependent methyltransferase n=1 Tax=Paeniglutamicibacter sp. MACA_103 TaxID=3377337 RepID=UPI00389468D7